MHFQTRSLTALSLAALMVAAAGCGSNRVTNPVSDTDAPTVSSTSPANGATSVAVITASFSEAMNASTLTTATFTVSGPGSTLLAGTVTDSESPTVAMFTPTRALAPGTTYIATITTGAQDLAGNSLASDHKWAFTTSIAPGRPSPSRTDPR